MFHGGSVPGEFTGTQGGCNPLGAEGSSVLLPPARKGGKVHIQALSTDSGVNLLCFPLIQSFLILSSVFPSLSQCRGLRHLEVECEVGGVRYVRTGDW